MKKRKSDIHGLGIFTSKQIDVGEVFYIIPLDKIVNNPIPRYACIGANEFVCDEIVINWVNHSCNPNTSFEISTERPHLKALRSISVTEEITLDYDKTEVNGSLVKCTCKDSNCRGFFLRRE